MKFEKNVVLTGMRTELLAALNVADNIWRDFGQELWVTSIADGKHSTTSLHYAGSAADLRSHYFLPDVKRKVCNALKRALPKDFDVVQEPTHIHLEFQPRYPRRS